MYVENDKYDALKYMHKTQVTWIGYILSPEKGLIIWIRMLNPQMMPQYPKMPQYLMLNLQRCPKCSSFLASALILSMSFVSKSHMSFTKIHSRETVLFEKNVFLSLLFSKLWKYQLKEFWKMFDPKFWKYCHFHGFTIETNHKTRVHWISNV